LSKRNRNSVAALLGALDVSPAAAMPVSFAWTRQELRAALRSAFQAGERAMLAFSFSTASREPVGRRLDLVRKTFGQDPERLLCLAGGPHPSGDPLGTLEMGFDLVIRGEGEETFPALLGRWSQGRAFTDLPGLAYVQEGQVHLNPPPPPVDIDRYPPFSLKHDRWGFIEISRGCPWGCRYCQTSYLTGRRMRHRSVAHVAGAIREARDRVGFSYARFITPNAFAYGSPNGVTPNLEAMEALLKAVSGLLGRDETYFGSFPSEVRPDSVTPEAVALVRRYAANDTILLGAQSGSQRLLNEMSRGHSPADIIRATRIIHEGGLSPTVDFIFGLPGETGKDRQETIAVIYEIVDLGATIHSHVFMPLPGTPWADMPPGTMAAEYESLVGELSRLGRHYGQWGRQERLARQ
jgi:B12-binding domain/radical SAM domain protein